MSTITLPPDEMRLQEHFERFLERYGSCLRGDDPYRTRALEGDLLTIIHLAYRAAQAPFVHELSVHRASALSASELRPLTEFFSAPPRPEPRPSGPQPAASP